MVKSRSPSPSEPITAIVRPQAKHTAENKIGTEAGPSVAAAPVSIVELSLPIQRQSSSNELVRFKC